MSHRLVLTLVAASLLLGACQVGDLHVDAYPTQPRSEDDCTGLIGDPPPKVAGQSSRRVANDVALAWGDPAIILRCGVDRPARLKPTSTCHVVDGVGWLAEKQADAWLFTTIGRQYFVSLEVPKAYDPAADALADVADLVGRHDPEMKACL